MTPEIARGGGLFSGNKTIYASDPMPQEILVMAPEVARGVPLQVYINV